MRLATLLLSSENTASGLILMSVIGTQPYVGSITGTNHIVQALGGRQVACGESIRPLAAQVIIRIQGSYVAVKPGQAAPGRIF
jgi:hypothetical protein